MRLQVLVLLFFLLIGMGFLGLAPIHLHEKVNDKLLHFGTFCVLSICLYYLWNLSFRRNLVLTSTVLLILTIGSECLQGLLPYRTFDWYDILANVLGSISGLMAAFLTDYAYTRKKEHKRRWGGKQVAIEQQALMEDGLEYLSDEDEHHTMIPISSLK